VIEVAFDPLDAKHGCDEFGQIAQAFQLLGHAVLRVGVELLSAVSKACR
jgi:hypothetical protein